MKLITTATNLNHPGFLEFRRSLDHFKWDYDIISDNYIKYGSKILNAYNYAKQSKENYLFITDAYDVFILDNAISIMSSIFNKYNTLDLILFNAEKGCWPYSEWNYLYPEVKGPWKYLNGGVCFVNRNLFIKMFEENPIKDEDNDQVNLAKIYLTSKEKYNMKLDNDCEVFQSIAFSEDNEFLLDRKGIFNSKTNTHPSIIHGNGGTDMKDIYNYFRIL